MEPESARVLNRESALGLLRVISDGLKPATDLFVGLVDEDVSLVRSHPAAELLDELMDAFVDLESGKTHCVFEPAPYGANASLTIGERKWDDEVLAAVMGIKRAKGFRLGKKPKSSWPQNSMRAAESIGERDAIRRRCSRRCATGRLSVSPWLGRNRPLRFLLQDVFSVAHANASDGERIWLNALHTHLRKLARL